MSDLAINSQIISSRDALASIIAAQGDLKVAAEINQVPQELLIAAIVNDEHNHDKLNKVLRTLSLMKLFGTLGELQAHLMEQLAEGNIKGRDVAKAFTDVASLLASLTDAPATTTNINVFDTVMRGLPPHVQTALQVIAGGRAEGTDAAA